MLYLEETIYHISRNRCEKVNYILTGKNASEQLRQVKTIDWLFQFNRNETN